MSERSAGRIIARNTAAGLLAQVALRGVGFLYQIFIVRQLGDAEFGRFSIITAWAGLFSVLGDLGVDQYFEREVARRPEEASDWFWDVVALRGVLAALAVLVTCIGAALLYPGEIVLGVALFTLTYFPMALQAPLYSLLVGHERLDLTYGLDVVNQLIGIVIGGLLLIVFPSYQSLLLIGFIQIPLMIGLTWRTAQRNQLAPPPFRLHPRLWWGLLRGGLPFGFTHLALSFSFRVDTIILSRLVSESAVGWYNMAYNLALSFTSLTQSFNDSVLPTLAREHAQDETSVHPWYFRSVRFMLLLGMPIAVGGMLLATPIITTLYGDPNLPAALLFMILIWDLPIVMYTSFCGNLTTSIQKERRAAIIYSTIGLANIGLTLLLAVPFGVVGASFATVLTDLVAAGLFYFLFRRAFTLDFNWRRGLTIVIACAVMGGLVVLLLPILPFWLIIPLVALPYGLLVWFGGALLPDERQRFLRLLRRQSRSTTE